MIVVVPVPMKGREECPALSRPFQLWSCPLISFLLLLLRKSLGGFPSFTLCVLLWQLPKMRDSVAAAVREKEASEAQLEAERRAHHEVLPPTTTTTTTLSLSREAEEGGSDADGACRRYREFMVVGRED